VFTRILGVAEIIACSLLNSHGTPRENCRWRIGALYCALEKLGSPMTPCEKVHRWFSLNGHKISRCSVGTASIILNADKIPFEVRDPEAFYALMVFDGILLYSRDGVYVESATPGC
jgi:hypothetical protein